MDEILDVVNSQDRIIGHEKKGKCRKEHLLHRNSRILIFKDKTMHEVLVQKRPLFKKRNPGKICFPGGHVKTGETYLEGAKREEKEEEYKHITPPENLEKLFRIKVDEDENEFIMIYRTFDKGPFDHDPNEVEEDYFINIHKLHEDVQKHPEKYTTRLPHILKKYLEISSK